MANVLGPDPVTLTNTLGTEAERAVHDGRAFTATHSYTIQPNWITGIAFAVKSKTFILEDLAISYDKGPLVIQFLESPYLTNRFGLSGTVANNNRKTPRVRGVDVYRPSIINPGRELARVWRPAPAGDDGEWRMLNSTWLLKPNTNYGIRLENKSSEVCTYGISMFFYELNGNG